LRAGGVNPETDFGFGPASSSANSNSWSISSPRIFSRLHNAGLFYPPASWT
jgi:hypothetical protein